MPLKYLSGDFDGDGLSDVVALEENSSKKAHLIKLDRRITSNFSSYIGNLSSQLQSTDKLLTMDVNGDGKTDILQFKEGTVYAYGLNNTNTSLQLLWQTIDASIKMNYHILPGDYNGDGKMDFIIPYQEGTRFYRMFLSTGVSFFEDRVETSCTYTPTYKEGNTFYGQELVPVDINGDGKTDIIDLTTETYDNSSNGELKIHVYENRGFMTDLTFYRRNTITKTGNLKHLPIPVFISSDKPNNNLEFATISDKWVTSFEFSKDNREDMALKSIENNGVTTEIKYDQVNPYYQDLNDPFYFSAYTPGYGQIFPNVNVNVAPSFKVVRELIQSGDNITRTKKFLYKGAISNVSGLGFMGFEELKRTNWYGDNVEVLWNISKHDPMLRNAVTEQWVATNSSSTPSQYLSKTKYFYDYNLISNPSSPQAPQYIENIIRNTSISGQQTDQAEETITFKPGFYALASNGTYIAKVVPPDKQPGASGYAGVSNIKLSRIENTNSLTGVSTTETYTYDQYNNPISTHRTFPGGSNTLTLQYSNNASATNNTYHVGKPIKKVESNTLNGNTFITEERYTYNNNLISETKIKGNGTSWVTTAFLYNANGSVTQKTTSTDGVTPRVEKYKYVGYGERFLTKSIDIENLETEFTYYPDTGLVHTTTDPYGFVTTFEYDKWGRLEKEIDYLSKETLYGYLPQTGGGLKETINYPTGAKEEVLYNAFGWVIKSGSLSLDNQWVYKSFEYDVAGRVRRKSEPYSGGASQWNTTYYDEYGRPDSKTLYNGKVVSTTYSNLTTTVNDGVKTVITTVDALGNIVSVQDPGGTINYTYYGNGSIKTADYDGNVVSVGIDGWGRKKSLNDPSAGNYTYTYDNFGQLKEETSPKGSTTYVYDAYGKPTSKVMTGDLTDYQLTYQYDNDKLLEKITGQDNINNRTYIYDYDYDSYKRPKIIKENTGAAAFELQYTYDAYGRVETEKQITTSVATAVSSTVTTRNVYDDSGILSEIWNNGTSDKLWELDAINARGQALTINLGNGMTKNRLYDAYGFFKNIEDKTSDTSPTVALHTEYNFNEQKGTLTNRENFGLNWQEGFGYDHLDRLTTIAGDATKTMSYDAKGRITNNTSIGAYAYNTTSKYQLKEITPNTPGETYFQNHPTQQISYNAFKKPIDIHENGHGRVSFEYSPMMHRSHAYYGGDDEDKLLRRYRKFYSAITGTEIVQDTQTGSTKIITYVSGDAYTAPIAYIKKTGANALDEYHYLHRDYLGSILAITDADGDVIEQRQFGAWGSVDKFIDSSGGTVFNHQSLLGRGYTGHEHFFEVALIHMNGRMYDPQLGRFLSPDNYIQEPFNTQSYNRYGYVLNNPLMYTDPTGELFGRGEGGFFGSILVGLITLGKAIFGGDDSGNSGGNHNQEGFATPSQYLLVDGSRNASIQVRQPNPDWTFDPPNKWEQYFSYKFDESEILYGKYNPPNRGDGYWGQIPLIGPLLRSRDRINEGNYIGAIEEFGWALIDAFSGGAGGLVGKKASQLSMKAISNAYGRSLAAKGGQTIVGEGMKRVSAAAAKNPGSTILNNMPKFSGSPHQVTSQMMQYNRKWLLQQMRSGKPIMDIGLDPTRGAPSIFYQMEQRMINNYLKLHPNAFKVIKP